MASTDTAIETQDLTKRYRKGVLAVDGLDLSIPRGEIYGFLGPNGAGKTTTLRLLTGLIRPTRGRASVLGQRSGAETALRRIGALIEDPAFYPYLSGLDNLRVLARYCSVDEAQCEAVIEQVGLTDAKRMRFRRFSTGMKQRLGLAAALLKDPEVLILDEPSSGLDPQGRIEMREVIGRLAEGDRTILLSSHLLGEVEQVCHRIGVIHHGRLVAEGRLGELRGASVLIVRARPLDRARSIGEELAAGEVEVEHGELRISINPERTSEVVSRLVQAGVGVEEVRREDRSLEEIFLSLTSGGA